MCADILHVGHVKILNEAAELGKVISTAPSMQVAVPMCADFFHPGHLRLLKEAAKHGKVTVWLMTDAAMQLYKRKPFFSFADRKVILLALKVVHAVIPIDHHPSKFPESIALHQPAVFVHGDDWKTGVQAQARANVINTLHTYGGRLVELCYTKGISSSKIHNAMADIENNLFACPHTEPIVVPRSP